MANKNKNNRKFTQMTTPLGVTGWASTAKVGKFGDYTLDLFLATTPENTDFLEGLVQAHTANIEHEQTNNGAKGTDMGLNFQVKDSDPEQFRGGGFNVIRFKSPGTNKAGETTANPKVFDSSGSLITLGHEIPIGSEVRVNLNLASYNYAGKLGSSLYINGIQIASMPERTQTEGTKSLFDSVEGGFVGVGNDSNDIGLD